MRMRSTQQPGRNMFCMRDCFRFLSCYGVVPVRWNGFDRTWRRALAKTLRYWAKNPTLDSTLNRSANLRLATQSPQVCKFYKNSL
jgi:hypothetical protein